MKEFLIIGNGEVKMIGFRPLLTSTGYLDYQIKVYASNVTDENKVRVVVEGMEDKVNKFIDDLREKKIKPEDIDASNFEVKGNSEIANGNHNYLEHTQALQLDQMGTFISEAKKMREELPKRIGESIDTGFKNGFEKIANAIKGK